MSAPVDKECALLCWDEPAKVDDEIFPSLLHSFCSCLELSLVHMLRIKLNLIISEVLLVEY
jgi:hypothetical protein